MDCAAPRHHHDPERAEPVAFLCQPCRRRLSRDLRRIPALDTELAAMLVTSRRGSNRGHGDGLPYNVQVSEHRDQIRHDLQWWTTLIAGTRQSPWPSLTVAAMAGWLHGQITWCMFRDFAGDMAGAVASDYARALALLDPWPASVVERKSLTCPCGGQLVFTMYGEQDKRASYAACRSCDGCWEIGPAWMTLRKQMQAA